MGVSTMWTEDELEYHEENGGMDPAEAGFLRGYEDDFVYGDGEFAEEEI